jgi:hypothetical protein
MFVREGYPVILGATTAVVLLFAAALRLRSWSVWLMALAATVGTLVISWRYR